MLPGTTPSPTLCPTLLVVLKENLSCLLSTVVYGCVVKCLSATSVTGAFGLSFQPQTLL